MTNKTYNLIRLALTLAAVSSSPFGMPQRNEGGCPEARRIVPTPARSLPLFAVHGAASSPPAMEFASMPAASAPLLVERATVDSRSFPSAIHPLVGPLSLMQLSIGGLKIEFYGPEATIECLLLKFFEYGFEREVERPETILSCLKNMCKLQAPKLNVQEYTEHGLGDVYSILIDGHEVRCKGPQQAMGTTAVLVAGLGCLLNKGQIFSDFAQWTPDWALSDAIEMFIPTEYEKIERTMRRCYSCNSKLLADTLSTPLEQIYASWWLVATSPMHRRTFLSCPERRELSPNEVCALRSHVSTPESDSPSGYDDSPQQASSSAARSSEDRLNRLSLFGLMSSGMPAALEPGADYVILEEEAHRREVVTDDEAPAITIAPDLVIIIGRDRGNQSRPLHIKASAEWKECIFDPRISNTWITAEEWRKRQEDRRAERKRRSEQMRGRVDQEPIVSTPESTPESGAASSGSQIEGTGQRAAGSIEREVRRVVDVSVSMPPSLQSASAAASVPQEPRLGWIVYNVRNLLVPLAHDLTDPRISQEQYEKFLKFIYQGPRGAINKVLGQGNTLRRVGLKEAEITKWLELICNFDTSLVEGIEAIQVLLDEEAFGDKKKKMPGGLILISELMKIWSGYEALSVTVGGWLQILTADPGFTKETFEQIMQEVKCVSEALQEPRHSTGSARHSGS